jgi:hypothetical protein
MVIKERKLAILIYLLRYGRITMNEAKDFLITNQRTIEKDWIKLYHIPGIYTNEERNVLFSFFYIISHRIPEFYRGNTRFLLKDVKMKSPPRHNINYTNIEEMREYFV